MRFSPAKLIALREAKGWSPSGLAYKAWGPTITSEGKRAAKNRDRISAYESGRNKPSPRYLKVVADALGVAPADLCYVDRTAVPPGPIVPLQITPAPNDPGKARLQVDMVVPFTVAAAIGERLGPHCS